MAENYHSSTTNPDAEGTSVPVGHHLRLHPDETLWYRLDYLRALGEASRVNGYTLCAVICLVDANQPIS